MVGLAKMPQTIFSGQDYMDFALADSVLHFNAGKRGHAGKFSQMGLDVGIHSHIYYWANDTRKICANAKKNSEKQKKQKKSLDDLKGYKERTRRTITH